METKEDKTDKIEDKIEITFSTVGTDKCDVFKKIDLDTKRIMAIIGDINSGKTNLGIYCLRQYKGTRKIYTLGYPKQIDNFITLNTKRDIERLTDSIIFIDELSKFYPNKERTNSEFLNVARVMGHNNNTLIFTTQLTQDLTNKMEAFVDTFLITKMADLRSLKIGSKVKYLIMDCADIRMTGHALNLKVGEYLYLSENSFVGEEGIKTFPFQNIGKDWSSVGSRSLPQASVGSRSLPDAVALAVA